MTDNDGTALPTIEQRFGQQIRALRQAAQLSQAELAQRMSLSGEAWHQTQVAKTEAGGRPVRLAEVDTFARALGVRAMDLLEAAITPQLPEADVEDLREQQRICEATLAHAEFRLMRARERLSRLHAEQEAIQHEALQATAEVTHLRMKLVAIEETINRLSPKNGWVA